MDLRTAIYKYCNYQERCHQEVKAKLYELEGSPAEIENLLAELIEQGLLNEERYARSYTRGRFRIKKWGRLKIIQHLKQKHISEYCIRRGLTEIDPDEYYKTLQQLASKKWQELMTEKNVYLKRSKTYRFLQQRGFESGLITEAVIELQAGE